MNMDNVKSLIEDDGVKDAVMKILNLEQSRLHLTQPQYVAEYDQIIEDAVNADTQD